MKTLNVLAFLIALAFFGFSARAQSPERANVLQNKDILNMIDAKIPTETIVSKIKGSTCSFNTAPSALIELASQGVPSEVLVAMIQANPPVMPKAPDMTVFGIPLGQRFALPECRKEKFLKSVTYLPARTICFQRGYGKESQSGPVLEGDISIEFPIMELPLGVTGGSLGGTIIDGSLEGVIVGTSGLSYQYIMLEKLKGKYGEPSLFLPRRVQNRLGAEFDTFTANWIFDNLIITFNGVDGSLDHGLVTIGTKKGAEYRERQLKELFKDRRPL
jgi:hypothetical protein